MKDLSLINEELKKLKAGDIYTISDVEYKVLSNEKGLIKLEHKYNSVYDLIIDLNKHVQNYQITGHHHNEE